MKKLSDLFLTGRAKYPTILHDLVRLDPEGNVIGACALGCMGLELGMTPEELTPGWFGDDSGYARSRIVAEKLDEWLGCTVMLQRASDFSDTPVFNHFFIMNDAGQRPDNLAAALDVWQAQFCGGLDETE